MATILVFTKYDDLAASTRHRFLQYRPWLEDAGIELVIEPLLANEYLEHKYNGIKINRLKIILSYIRRLSLLLFRRNFDLIIVQYELFPYLPGFFEKLIKLSGKPIVYECDDATFQQYYAHKRTFIRRALQKILLSHKLESLLQSCVLAICGNKYLEEWASQHCSHTEIVPTVVDTNIYKIATHNPSRKVAIGWIGSPSTFQYVEPILDLLNYFATENDLTVKIIGSGLNSIGFKSFELIDWSEQYEVQHIQEMDIGIMPIPDDPWAQGKCGFKLIQYMACGLPVVASPAGVNSQIIDHGVNGFIVNTEREWLDALKALIADSDLRHRMGREGRQKAEEWYSLQVQAPRITAMLSNILEQSIGEKLVE